MPNKETQPEKTEETEGKTFTQEEVDALIKKRLARAKSDVPSDYEELKEKATKFDEIQTANKTELEKANEELGRLRADIAKREFWNSVDLTGNQTTKMHTRALSRFWSSVDLTGNQTDFPLVL